MQKSKQEDLVKESDTEEPTGEIVEIEQDDAPRRPRSAWFYVIWAIVILCIIGFAVFGVTTLMHIPPTIEKDTGFVPVLQALL